VIDVQIREVGRWSCHSLLYTLDGPHYVIVRDDITGDIRQYAFKNDGWNDFHKIWYWCYIIRDCSKLIIYNFMHLVIPTWRMLQVMRWEFHPLPWYRYQWSSATKDDLLARDVMYQWSYEQFVLQSNSGLRTQHVAIITPEESLFIEKVNWWALEIINYFISYAYLGVTVWVRYCYK
jgi:hypothetical protein